MIPSFRHRCDSCGKRFRYRHHLERHRLLHTGEMPFACDDCGIRFNREDRLKLQ